VVEWWSGGVMECWELIDYEDADEEEEDWRGGVGNGGGIWRGAVVDQIWSDLVRLIIVLYIVRNVRIGNLPSGGGVRDRS